MKTNRGSAMIVALIISIVVVGIGGTFLATTAFRSKANVNAVQSDEAQMLLDAALEKIRRALYLYQNDNSYPWDQILADHNGLSINPNAHLTDYLARKDDADFVAYHYNYYSVGVNTSDESPLPTDPDHFLAVTKPLARGGFYAVVRDNDDGDGNLLDDTDDQLMVYITASLPDGTQRQIEALVQYNPGTFLPDSAVLVDGSLKVNGNPLVQGTKGSVHANRTLDISGNPTIAVNATAAETLTVSGNPTVGGILDAGPQYQADIPDVSVASFINQADWQLRADGNVYTGTGAFVANGSQGWNEFKYQGQQWVISGNTAHSPGAYYIETDFKISGNPGTPASPQVGTYFVVGSVSISGNPSIQPYIVDLAVVSGGDIQLSGNPDGVYNGFYYATEQLKINGNPNLVGSFVAKDKYDYSNEVSAGSAVDPLAGQVSGNPIITYDGNLDTGIAAAGLVAIQNVRRLK